LDVLTGYGTYGGTIAVLRGRGDGTFDAPPIRYGEPDGLQSIAAADLDQDGHLDVVSVSDPTTGDSRIAISFGGGAGTFRQGTEYTTNEALSKIALGDVDGDGDTDIATNGDLTTIQIYLNSGNGSFTLDAVYRREGSSQTIAGIVLTDGNHDGILDVLATTTG